MLLNFLTGTSLKSGTGTGTTGGLGNLMVIVGYIVVFGAFMYFLIIRPQKKKQKTEEKMRTDLQIGDEIVTIGGIMGRVVSLKEDSLIIETGPDRTKQRIARWSIQQNLTVHDDTK